MNRQVLEYNGSLFETEIARYLYAHFKGIKVIVDKSTFSAYLRKDTQIDVIAVCDFGIFVIEAKNWKAWIKGEYNDTKWAGKSSGRDAMVVYNVVDQNFIHVRALRNRLRAQQVPLVPFHSIVCVPDGTQVISRCSEICNLSELGSKMMALGSGAGSVDVDYYAEVIKGA